MATDWTSLQPLFVRYRDGQEAAARPVFEGIQQALTGFFWVRTRSEDVAADLAQVTLLKIHFARDSFDPDLSLKTWVFSIAGRALIDHWRGHREPTISLDVEHGDTATLADLDALGAHTFELRDDLRKALDALTPIDRTIVYLYGVEGFSMAEISEHLQLTEAAVKLRASRSYKQLRPLLSALTLLLVSRALAFWFRS